MLGINSNNRFLWSIEGRGIIIHITGGNIKILARGKVEYRTVTHHGDVKGEVQVRSVTFFPYTTS